MKITRKSVNFWRICLNLILALRFLCDNDFAIKGRLIVREQGMASTSACGEAYKIGILV